MKNKIIVIAVIVAAVIASWGITIYSQNSNEARIVEIKTEIKENEELGIYKKNLSLYKELISSDKKNIQLYVELADCYYNLKQYGNFEKACDSIITAFPEDITGYLKLAKYYSKDNRHDKVIEVYGRLPESLKNNKEFAQVYEGSEYKYEYMSRIYEEIGEFQGDFAAVKLKDLYGYIDKDTSDAIGEGFSTARPFIENMAAVYNDGEWYFIDKDGDKILATKESVEDLHSMSEGYAAAEIDGKYGFVDSKFSKVHFDYDYVTNFYNGVAAVKKNGKWAIINNKFEKVTEAVYDGIVYDEANICSRKGIIFAKKDGTFHMLDITGKEITEDTFEDACMFVSDEPAAVKKDGKWGFIDKKGKKVIDFKFDGASSFNLGLAPVCVNNKWGFINAKGDIAIENDFDGARTFYNSGVTSVKIGDTYRLIQLIKYKK